MSRRVAWFALALGLGLLGPRAGAEQPAPPEARQVIVRGRADLADAIRAALGPFEDIDTAVLVLDVTPHTRAARGTITSALDGLERYRGLPSHWRVARLGERVSPAVGAPSRLAAIVGALLAKDTPVSDTVGALRTTVKTIDAPSGAVVYLADWRFEDEYGVEDLIRLLARLNLRFGVVGSEAAFGRAWNDGVRDIRERFGHAEDAYDPGIGRAPYGPFDAKAPWHGGDSAAPHVPYRYAAELWQTEFTPSDLSFQGEGLPDLGRMRGTDLEDLLERLGREVKASGESGFRRFPLPSAFGPHGLMRAAGVRGGRYVLWSWNPEHRAAVHYDGARCDRFGPDLHRRADVRKAQGRDPAARAMLRAWSLLTERRTAVVAHTAPLGKSAGQPRSIDLLGRELTQLPTAWPDRGLYRAFLERAGNWRDALVQAGKILERGIEKAESPRLRADAELFRHIALVLSFELGEALHAAESVPPDAWKDDETFPGLRRVTWIERGDDPAAIRTTGATLFDPSAGEVVKAARVEHLRRFGGTPFGLQVAANPVDTWQATRFKRMKPQKGALPGRTPAESGGDTRPPSTPRAPGGGSTGGGPTTGR